MDALLLDPLATFFTILRLHTMQRFAHRLGLIPEPGGRVVDPIRNLHSLLAHIILKFFTASKS